MLKMCGRALYKPLDIIYKFSFENVVDWKLAKSKYVEQKKGKWKKIGKKQIGKRQILFQFAKKVIGRLYKTRLLKEFLSNQKQRSILNVQSSSWAFIKAGITKDPILGPLMYFQAIFRQTQSYSLMILHSFDS